MAPRLGIAYRLNEKTVIRTGAGISVDPNTFRYLRDDYPATISTQYSGANAYQAAGTLRTGIPSVVGPDLNQTSFMLPAAVGTTTFPQVFNRGYIESYNFTVQRDAGAGINVQAAYVGSRAIRSTAIQNINAAGPGGGNAGRYLYPSFGRIADIKYFMPFNTASYNSFQTQVTRRFAGSLLGVSYTLSRAIGYVDDTDGGLTWNWVPMLQRNKAVAGFDRTHNLQFYGNYDLPFGRGQKYANSGLLSKIVGGWQTNWILSRMSGTPFTVGTSGTSVNSPGNTQTADQILSNVAILGGHGLGQPYFDPNAFGPVTTARFGSSGRNLSAGTRRLQSGWQPVPQVQDDGTVRTGDPLRNVRRHQYAAVRQPRRHGVFAHKKRRWHHQGTERLHRNHQRERRTSGPLRREDHVLTASNS